MKKLFLSLGLILSVFCFSSASVFPADFSEIDKELKSGILSLQIGDYEDALGNFQKVLDLDPVNSDAYYYLGMTYSQMEEFDKAVSYYEKALKLNPELAKAHFQVAVAYYQQKQYANALRSLSKAEKYLPQDAMVYYYQGATYYSMKKYYKSVAPFEKVKKLDPALTVLSYYWQGVALFQQGLYIEAEKLLREVKRLSAESQLGNSADEFLDAIEKRTKPLSVKASLGVEYDDNVTLQPVDEDVSEISDKEDERAVVNLKFSGRKFLEPGEFGAYYSFYQSLHQDLTEYNVQGHTGSLYFASNLRPFQPYIQYSYDYYFVDNDKYLEKHTIIPSLNISVASPHITQVYFQYEKFNYLIDFDEDEYDRSADANALGVNQYFSIVDGKGYIKIGAEYKNNDAEGDDWDYYGSKIRLTVYSPTPVDKMSVEIGGEQSYSNFDNEDSFFEKTRKDTYLSGWIELMYKLNDNWGVGLNYKHINNNSNIDFYEYQRNITSLFLSCSF
ncbi:MAG: tetratricopeptide repeat protein [Candidatus Ratteibacteria bacterium]|nr:tetratricopeptide repeat protein [Candidatus Ratteibacteria bacterium]